MFRFGTMQVLELLAQSKISFISSVRRSNSHPEIKSNQHIFWPHGNINEATWHHLGATWTTFGHHLGQLRKHHLKQQQMPKTSHTPNRTPSKPAKTHRVHKPKSQMRQRCFVSKQCSGVVPNMTNMRWMPAKIILNFPGRERCLQNDC